MKFVVIEASVYSQALGRIKCKHLIDAALIQKLDGSVSSGKINSLASCASHVRFLHRLLLSVGDCWNVRSPYTALSRKAETPKP